jgi:hypothetical protein
MIGSSGSLARQSPLRLSPKAVYAMRSTMLPWAFLAAAITKTIVTNIAMGLIAQMFVAYAVSPKLPPILSCMIPPANP